MAINNWLTVNMIWITISISILVLVYFIYAIIQTVKKKRRIISQLTILLLILGLIFLVFLTYRASELKGADWGQVILMIGLVSITAVYASSTEKMATEMREQTIISSRPYIIQKAVTMNVIPSEYSTDYFEIYNAGNGPAIEVEISLVLQRKPPYTTHNATREGFLRAGDNPVEFHTTFPLDIAGSIFYIVSEYQGISSHSTQPTWYQTWLPFKLSVNGRVICGKLEFVDDVSEKNHVGIYNSEFIQ